MLPVEDCMPRLEVFDPMDGSELQSAELPNQPLAITGHYVCGTATSVHGFDLLRQSVEITVPTGFQPNLNRPCYQQSRCLLIHII